jgi:hypothetical protein
MQCYKMSLRSSGRIKGSWRRSKAILPRTFASTTRRRDSYGFIGLGQMVSFNICACSRQRADSLLAGLSNGKKSSNKTVARRLTPPVRRQRIHNGEVRRGSTGVQRRRRSSARSEKRRRRITTCGTSISADFLSLVHYLMTKTNSPYDLSWGRFAALIVITTFV